MIHNLMTAFACVLCLTAMGTAQASHIEGDWLGTLRIQAVSLRIVFHLSRTENGAWNATMDSPDQGANGLPVDQVTLDGRFVRLTSSMVSGEFAGTIQEGDSVIDGRWTQSNMDLPLRLARITGEVTVNRPQDPQPPFPYRTEEVTFRNEADEVSLAGTLSIPQGDGPFPAVALVTGSGPQDRDETVFGHKPFKVIADHLTRNGIAVLRYDDRGFGGSTGNFAGATTADLSRDAEAALTFLRTRPDIDASHTGLLGHSEGALIAPMVAARSEYVAFIVMLAGPSISGERITLLQDSLISAANGIVAERIVRGQQLTRRLFDFIGSEEDTSALRTGLTRMLREAAASDSDTTVPAEALQTAIDQNVSRLMSPWMRFFLSYDPVPALTNVSCPVLALNGEKDLQVPSRINLDGIKAALRDGGNTHSTVRELQGLNHLFQTAGTGSPTEYNGIEETISPTVLALISDWIRDVTIND